VRIQELFTGMFATAEYGNSANFADNSGSCRRILVKLFRGTGCLTSNKPFSFGVDPDRDPDPGISNGIFTTAG